MISKIHPEWPAFEAKLTEQIAEHHRALEDATLDLPATNYIRGQIAALRKVIDDATPPEPAVRVPGYSAA